MTLSEFTLAERGFSDLNIIPREFWFQISPTSPETWVSMTEDVKDESVTSLTSSDTASSFSEMAFSQLALSELGLLVTRETWQVILSTTSTESWSNVSPSGSETWSGITPSNNETWKNIL